MSEKATQGTLILDRGMQEAYEKYDMMVRSIGGKGVTFEQFLEGERRREQSLKAGAATAESIISKTPQP